MREIVGLTTGDGAGGVRLSWVMAEAEKCVSNASIEALIRRHMVGAFYGAADSGLRDGNMVTSVAAQ